MATYRIGIGSFNLKDGAVGIGTESTGLGNLKVEGTIKTTDLDVTGVSTFTRYAGFVADDININRDTSLTGEHSTIGDIVVGLNSTFTVSTGATVTVGTVESVSIGTHFSPPTGGINDRPEVPVEGTVRFNIDLNTLEFYNGVEWRQFTVSGARGRGLSGGGAINSANQSNIIEYIQIQTLGNSISFGELNVLARYNTAVASSTRGLFAGGYSPVRNTIDYVEISTLGNAADFGDLFTGKYYGSGCASPVRGIFQGVTANNTSEGRYQYVTIASKGNSIEWGDPYYKRTAASMASNSVRGIIAGGVNAEHPWFDVVTKSIEYITIASTGSAEYFGELQHFRSNSFNGCSTSTRAVFCGGSGDTADSPNATLMNSSEFVTIASSGNAQDFGDLSEPRRSMGQCSDSHGGLGGY